MDADTTSNQTQSQLSPSEVLELQTKFDKALQILLQFHPEIDSVALLFSWSTSDDSRPFGMLVPNKSLSTAPVSAQVTLSIAQLFGLLNAANRLQQVLLTGLESGTHKAMSQANEAMELSQQLISGLRRVTNDRIDELSRDTEAAVTDLDQLIQKM